MENREFIPVAELCRVYEIDLVFIESLSEYELVEVIIQENVQLVPISNVSKLEQIIRIHRDLHVNIEGVDVILNLLNKVDKLENELYAVRDRLSLYENNK